VTTTRYIPRVELAFPTFRFGWLYYKGEDKDAEEGVKGEGGGKKEEGKQKVQPFQSPS
jgi:hypothetical protein